MQKIVYLLLITTSLLSHAQKPLTAEILEQSAIRFTLSEDHQLTGDAREQWLEWIGDSQYVGLAEVHNSAQLSYFTKALLKVLAEKDFKHFAMEMGPTTATILEEKVKDPSPAVKAIQQLNRQYGKNTQFKTPLIFVNKIEDAQFVEQARSLGFTFWGLDQEYAHSYVMLVDHLYTEYPQAVDGFAEAYSEARAAIERVIFKDKFRGSPVYCWYATDPYIAQFFSFFEFDKNASKIIGDIRTSWDIYCKAASKTNSNQVRADHMKQNFDHYSSTFGQDAKVFVKLGGIHLTHGISTYGVDDMGKFLTEKAEANNAEFITIRHLITYRKGKSNIGKSSWKNTWLFLELGRKDQWTVVDLRPFREMLKNGEIVTERNYAFELMSYDFLLISPDDQYPKVNY